LQLLEYDYEVVCKSGSQNVVADALSRVEINVNINQAGTDNQIATSTTERVRSADSIASRAD